MIDVTKIREDFPILKTQMHQHPLIYFDNGATTLKPKCVIDAVCDYLTNYSGNAHRGDYDLSHDVDVAFENARETIQTLIHASLKEEIVYTSGSTDSLNMIAYGYVLNHIQEGDEILIDVAEHASNTLPWFDIADMTGAVVKYIDLDEEGRITLENVKKAITDKTRYISIAIVTNVLGYLADMKSICEYAHSKDIIVIADGAQSVPHHPINVVEDDIDFLAFSGHKMCGPTGIGVLYGKINLLEDMKPVRRGGGSNSRYNACGEVTLKKSPYKFEAGTPNIEGAIGLGAAIKYLESIGMDNIFNYEQELRTYAIQQLETLDNIDIYNKNGTGAIAFNIKNVFSQDGASLFNTYGIAVRAGEHCAKILDNFLPVRATLRASFYFYNTKEEIDQFIEVCKKGDDFLDAFFD